MKKETNPANYLILIAFLTLLITPSYGQSSSNFDLSRRISMTEPDSQTRNINLSIQKNNSKVHIGITAEIRYGSLTIRIFNPRNEIVGEFSIESQIATGENKFNDAIKEVVSGRIQKVFNNPISGKWIVQMDSDEVIGEVKFDSSIISTQE